MFEHRLLEARKKKGLTQKQVAEQAEIHVASYSAYENNHKMPPVDILLRIANVLEVSMDWLCGKGETANTFTSYGDAARAILRIKENFGLNTEITTEVRDVSCDYDYAGYMNITAIEVNDAVLFEFFQKMDKFKSMGTGSADEKELYSAWIATKLRELEKMPIHDPDLPF